MQVLKKGLKCFLMWRQYILAETTVSCWEGVPGSALPYAVLYRAENKISCLIFSEISTEQVQIIGLQYLHCKSPVKRRKVR